jgi:ribosomal protein S27E
MKFTCPSCAKDIIIQYLSQGQIVRCRHCGAEVPVPENAEFITTEQVVEYADKLRAEGRLPGAESQHAPSLKPTQRRKVGFLRVIAWLILIAGIFFGLLMILGGFFLMYEGWGGIEGLGAGIGLIIQSIAICGLLLVIAMIAESLIDIQEKMATLIRINRKDEDS